MKLIKIMKQRQGRLLFLQMVSLTVCTAIAVALLVKGIYITALDISNSKFSAEGILWGILSIVFVEAAKLLNELPPEDN